MSWSIDKNILFHQLTIVFIGCKHISFHVQVACLGGKGAYNIIGFVSLYLENRDIHGLKNLLYDGNRQLNVFRSLFSLSLIVGKCLVTKGGTARVERHS